MILGQTLLGRQLNTLEPGSVLDGPEQGTGRKTW